MGSYTLVQRLKIIQNSDENNKKYNRNFRRFIDVNICPNKFTIYELYIDGLAYIK